MTPATARVTRGWIDSHCHVHDERMPGGADAAVAEAHAAGVAEMIAVGCDRPTSLAALEVAARHQSVHATVGLHPHDASQGVETIVDLLERQGVIAIGECGLDYFYDHSPRGVQREAFAAQIVLANERELPLVIHTRDAWDDTFDVLDEIGAPARTIFHCFTGGVAEAERCLERGGFLSFSGIVTFPTATDVQAAVAACPLDRLLVETDSPYLAPVPYRGKPNRPAWVPAVAAHVAKLRRIDVDQLELSTSAATRRAFGLVPQTPSTTQHSTTENSGL